MAVEKGIFMDLSEEETKQLMVVMKKAQEFEMLEEKQLMRQPLEGQLSKYTNVMKGWQYRWFVLNPDLGKLEYFEKEDHKKCYRPRGCLTLIGAVVCPSDEDSQTFTVNAANGESYRLKAYDARERQHWVNRLRATAEYHTETSMNASFGRNGTLDGVCHSTDSPPTSSRSVESVNQTRTPQFPPKDSPKLHITTAKRKTENTQSLNYSLKECNDQITTVRINHQLLISTIESLPSSGDLITSLNKDVLLLKATSTATLSCLDKCLAILHHQANKSNEQEIDGQSSNTICSDSPPSAIKQTTSHNVILSSHLEENTKSAIDDDYITDSDGQLKINHSEEVEDPVPYSDTELSGMEEHKTIILHLLSQLKLGMDLTKVVLPTFILEKRSLLELFADCMAHPDLFLRIPEMPTPESRILSVLDWYLTSFHSGRQGSIAKKPYNPIIGETFHCSWVCSSADKHSQPNSDEENSSFTLSVNNASLNATSDQSSGSQNQQQNAIPTRLYYCAEQVSHHPPVSAFYFESPDKQMCMDSSIWTRSKFMGMSIGVVMIGKVHLRLLSHSEEYEFSLPSAYARSILTVPWVELGDKVTLQCEKTGFSAAIIFHTKPFYGGRVHKITAEVKNPSNEIICRVSGEWNGTLEFIYADGHTKTIDTTSLPVVRKCVRPLKLQGNMESRKLWKDVTENLENGDIEKATEHKQCLEEMQRQEEKRRRESRLPFPTKYFCRVGDEWVFKNHLQTGQKEPSL